MSTLYIGTSGYDYPEWVGPFYPEKIKQKDRLSYYAEHFNAIELNFSYYRMPTKNQIENMIQRSNGKLHFTIKANKQLTHEIDPNKWKDIAAEYRQSITPLLDAGLLLSVLLQFPETFIYNTDSNTPDNRSHLAALITAFEGFPLVFEPRHRSWQKESVYAGLTQRQVAWCICDMPDLKDLPTINPIITSPTAYLRFHGQNAKNWYNTNARDRHDYLYTDTELAAIIPTIKTLTATAQLVQIYFNNHAKAYAAINAKKLKILLT
jgi:uncharacterized protein YecE (DUF72 family)